MVLEIFYNQGGVDVLPLEYLSRKGNARTLARQISECDLVYATRLRDKDDQTEDFRDGKSEHE